MTTAGLADLLTIVIAAILSFTLVDLIKRRRNARIYLFVSGLWSLVRLALPFGSARPGARKTDDAAAAPDSAKRSRQVERQARRARR